MFRLATLVCLAFLGGFIFAQTGTYADSIVPKHPRFQSHFAEAHAQFSPKDSFDVIFIGSSSIRGWKNLKEDFSPYRVMNMGFGGSTLVDLNLRFPEWIRPLRAKVVVLYIGENDLSLPYATLPDILEQFNLLMSQLVLHWPRTHLVYISVKPSIKSAEFLEKQQAFNTMAKEIIHGMNQKNKRCTWVNLHHEMLDGTGKAKRSLFLKDGLHMNTEGYALWKRKLRPVIDSLLLPNNY